MRVLFWSMLTGMVLLTHPLSANIDAQIDAIKHASVKERFKLMNAFKKNLIKMNEKERIKAMMKLTNSKKAKQALDEIKKKQEKNAIKRQLEYHHIEENNIVNETDTGEDESDN